MEIKTATTVEEQVNILIKRGLIIDNKSLALAKLLDIGYYRLGFYGFHFEKKPLQKDRNHIYKKDTKFEYIIELYDFDNRLRHLLLLYLHKIEVNLRTTISYQCSLRYIYNPCWFVDENIMYKKFVASFDKLIYNNLREHNSVISKHHTKHKCAYAPAWKTLEFLTMGNIEVLYSSLKNKELKNTISSNYKCSIRYFCNYLYVIRTIRNVCSHGNCIYNFSLPMGILRGVATSSASFAPEDYYNLKGVVYVMMHLLKCISTDLSDSFISEYNALFLTEKSPEVDSILRKTTKSFGV